jgi:RNA polymerase sigma-70 factor (ECF subfamily)
MDREFFWQLLEPIHGKAVGFCRGLTGDPDSADDLYQDGILQAWSKFETLKDHAAFRPWLYRILINRHKNSCRLWRCRRLPLSRGVLEDSRIDPGRDWEARLWLRRALRILSPRDRALIILYEIEGWGIEDLANVFEMPGGTVKTRLRRSRRRMRELLQRCGLKDRERNSGGAYALSRSQTRSESR